MINRTTDYAVRFVLYLASRGDGAVSSTTEIADEAGIPLPYARKVLRGLVRAGIVFSQAGKSGGVRLLSPSEELTVLDIIEAMEGPLVLNRCLIRPGECSRDQFCPMHKFWKEVQSGLTALLSQSISKFLKGGKSNSRRRSQ